MIATRRIGSLAVPELGFGAAPLGNLYCPVPDEAAAGALAAALDAGLRYVDTAPFYGFGLSELRVGDAVRGREDVVVSTKVGRLLRPLAADPGLTERHGYCSPMPFEPVFDYSHDGILRSHEASLARLGVERIDLLYIHDIGRLTHGEGHDRTMEQLTGGGVAALERLRGEGAIAGFGLGVNEIAACLELMEHVRLDAILLAGRYTLLEQNALDELLPRCRDEGTALVVGGPYNSGILAAGSGAANPHYDYAAAPPAIVAKVRRIEAVCARHGVATGAAALQFVLAHPTVASVIPGLASAAEVEATLDFYRTPIPADLWAELKEEKLLREDAPTPVAVTA
jgi:D-threo-aldose 1-dehydrogenase